MFRSSIKFLVLIGLLTSVYSKSADAKFYGQLSTTYSTSEDDAENFSFNRMMNMLYAGGSIDGGGRFYIGWNYFMWSRTTDNDGTESEISLTEQGPRFLFFFNEMRTLGLSASWHPYVKGERTLSGTNQELSGSGYTASFLYHLKVNNKFYMGFSVNYHSATLDEQTVGTTLTEITESYSNIVPMIDLSFRFR